MTQDELLKLIDQAAAESLVELDLRDTQLTQLPPEIGQLSSLQKLDLRYNQLTQLPSEIGLLTSLQKLNLRYNQLTQLPSEIGLLTSLQQLDLRGNRLTQLPSEIGLLTSLQQLDLSYNRLTQLPPEIGQIIALQQLDFYSNQLTQLPTEIGWLTSLQSLDLGHNQLTQTPSEIGQLSSLQKLDLSSNRLTRIPPEIGQLSYLQQLDLSCNRLTQLRSKIGQFHSLQLLNLSYNQLTHLPFEIGQFLCLQQLNLSCNKIAQLPPEIKKFDTLHRLELSFNQLTHLPPDIEKLTYLQQLNLSYNRLTQLSSKIGKLASLQRLNLCDNQLTHLPPEVGQLTSLQELDLSHNHLEELIPEIGQLTSLQQLNLYCNRLISPPPEIVDKGIQGILGYLRQQLEQGEDYLYEAKFLIVGEGGAGKTSLARKIVDSNYELDSQEATTEGIDVSRWDFKLRDTTIFRANIWDFGGQEIYHATHQFFLTKSSLYVIIIDARQDSTDLYYWLSIVNLLSNSSPVLIIKNEKQDRKCEINERLLRSEFKNLRETIATNLQTNRGLEELKLKIQQYIAVLPHIGTALPKKWVDVRQALETDKRNYIHLKEYYQICETHGFTQQNDQLQLSEYLHDLGVCLHFQQDPILKHTVILKPEWGTTAVYKALDTKEVRENLGRFTRSQLNIIWNEQEYTNMRDELLQLMMRFKLCYEIPGCPQHYIAPQLLSSDQPKYHWNHSPNLILRYRYDFMPKGILTRLIVELHEFIENQMFVWKTGVVLTNGIARAEVTEHYPKSEIRIRVSETDQKRWLSAITHELEKIHRSYERLCYQTLIPCNCSTCKGSQDPHDYPYERLQKFLHDGQYQIQCQESYRMVDVRGLLDNIFYYPSNPQIGNDQVMGLDAESLQGLPLQSNIKILNSAQKQTFQFIKEVFISYAWGGDSEEITNKIDIAFETNDIRLVRDKRELNFKGRIKAFMQGIGKGKAVIVIISDKYLKSENCMFELVEIAANGSFYDRIFPIVLNDAQIYKPIKRIRYIQHWEQEIAELEEAMKTVSAANMQGFRESIDLYTRIRATIADLTETLKDMNTLTPEIHTDSGFAELISTIEKRLES